MKNITQTGRIKEGRKEDNDISEEISWQDKEITKSTTVIIFI